MTRRPQPTAEQLAAKRELHKRERMMGQLGGKRRDETQTHRDIKYWSGRYAADEKRGRELPGMPPEYAERSKKRARDYAAQVRRDEMQIQRGRHHRAEHHQGFKAERFEPAVYRAANRIQRIGRARRRGEKNAEATAAREAQAREAEVHPYFRWPIWGSRR